MNSKPGFSGEVRLNLRAWEQACKGDAGVGHPFGEAVRVYLWASFKQATAARSIWASRRGLAMSNKIQQAPLPRKRSKFSLLLLDSTKKYSSYSESARTNWYSSDRKIACGMLLQEMGKGGPSLAGPNWPVLRVWKIIIVMVDSVRTLAREKALVPSEEWKIPHDVKLFFSLSLVHRSTFDVSFSGQLFAQLHLQKQDEPPAPGTLSLLKVFLPCAGQGASTFQKTCSVQLKGEGGYVSVRSKASTRNLLGLWKTHTPPKIQKKHLAQPNGQLEPRLVRQAVLGQGPQPTQCCGTQGRIVCKSRRLLACIQLLHPAAQKAKAKFLLAGSTAALVGSPQLRGTLGQSFDTSMKLVKLCLTAPNCKSRRVSLSKKCSQHRDRRALRSGAPLVPSQPMSCAASTRKIMQALE